MASLSSEHEAPAEVPTGAPSGAAIEETTVSFGFPAVLTIGSTALFFLGAAFPFPGRHFSKTTREEARV
jgi:hypothetical protein